MTQDNTQILYDERLAKTELITNQILEIMKNNNSYKSAQELLEKNVNKKLSESKLRVAFIGQYSAGKSTIISALTGVKDIKIDSDVATDSTQDYSWNNVVITDTPGIGTDNSDHDEKTYELLKRADIIVYCLTYSLFNPESLQNFKKIAYEKKYANKIMLVVNKMDSEQGVFPNLVRNYTQTLQNQLLPHDLDKFPITFIISAFELDPDLKAYSNFGDFRSKLNQLIADQDKFSELDSITHTIIDTVEDAIIDVDDLSSNERIKLGKMMENKYYQTKQSFNSQVYNKLSQFKSDVTSLGIKLSQIVADEGFGQKVKDSERVIQELYEEITKGINSEYKTAIDRLELDLDQIGNSETYKNVEKMNFEAPTRSSKSYSTYNVISKNAIKGANTVGKMSQGAKYSGGFLKSASASGSNTHNIVKIVGKQIGFKFKPWQAVNIAKNIGNVAKVAGPLVGVASLYLDYKDDQKEQENDRELLGIQNDVRNSYIEIGEDMYRELQSGTDEVNKNVFDSVITEIKNERENIIFENEILNSTSKQLFEKVDELKELIA